MDNPSEKLWCLQLIKEFEQLCATRSLALQCPNFEIVQGKQQIGHWNNSTKTICLSAYLITHHTWHVVLEVLKHEIAHQYVSEVLCDDASLPHGSSFKKACSIVGVHPRFRNATGKLPKTLINDHSDVPEKNKYLKKIEKLFALAESAAEHESAVAMEKANRLISKYNIEILASSTSVDYDYLQLKVGNKKIHSWTKNIIAIVRDFFFVKAIYLTQYDANSNQDFKAVEFLGRPENIAIAKHVFFFLHERLEILWRDFKNIPGVKGRDKRSYFLGILYGFREKLELSDRNNTDNQTTTSALVLSQDHKLNSFFNNRYPKTQTSTTRSTSIGAQAFNSGLKKGKQLNIYKTVTKKTNYTNLKITLKK